MDKKYYIQYSPIETVIVSCHNKLVLRKKESICKGYFFLVECSVGNTLDDLIYVYESYLILNGDDLNIENAIKIFYEYKSILRNNKIKTLLSEWKILCYKGATIKKYYKWI